MTSDEDDIVRYQLIVSDVQKTISGRIYADSAPLMASRMCRRHGYKSEEVRHPCAFLVIIIVLNVQIYIGAWAWNAKTMM